MSAAYLRLLGVTQAEAARAVGRSERTIQAWEADPSWERAQDEARSRWLVDLKDASRRTVLRSVQAGNAELAFRVLERTVPELRPPEHRHRHTGVLGLVQALEMLPEGELERLLEADDEELVRRLERLSAGDGAVAALPPGSPGGIEAASPGRDVTALAGGGPVGEDEDTDEEE